VPPSCLELQSCSAPTAASARTDLDRSAGLGVVAGARRNGPTRPRAQRTAGRRQHMCSALLPRQRIGSEVVARCLCSDKIKYKYGRGIYMRYGCHLLYKLWHSTQLHWSPCHTHSEVAGLGKYHPLLCVFCGSRGVQIFCRLCFGTPVFPTANSQMRMALFHWWLPKNAAGYVGFASYKMLLSWQ
jgi:hypothetical protein